MAFLQNLFGPIAPGVSPAANPLAFIGAGLATGDPGAALSQMVQLQQTGQQLRQQQMADQQRFQLLQAEQQAQQSQREAMSRAAMAIANPMLSGLAPNVMEEQRTAIKTMAENTPEMFMEAYTAGEGPFAQPEAPEPPKISDIGSMRKEFSKESQGWKTTRDAFERIEASKPTGPGDISLLTAYMKVLDPGSTVREGEFATAANAGGVSNQIRGLYNSLIKGERLTPELRAEFKNQAAEFLRRQRDLQVKREGTYQGLASRAGILPEDVAPDYLGRYREEIPTFSAPAPTAKLPQAASVQSEAQNLMQKYLGP